MFNQPRNSILGASPSERPSGMVVNPFGTEGAVVDKNEMHTATTIAR